MDYQENTDLNDQLTCCGINEIESLQQMQDVKRFVLELADRFFNEDSDQELPAFIIFSTVKGDKGQELAKFIEKNGMGQVAHMRPRKNPNTGSMITMWCWGLNKKTLKMWWAKNVVDTNVDDLEDEDEA